jgi:hypothetical protein
MSKNIYQSMHRFFCWCHLSLMRRYLRLLYTRFHLWCIHGSVFVWSPDHTYGISRGPRLFGHQIPPLVYPGVRVCHSLIFISYMVYEIKACVTNPLILSPARLRCTYGAFLGNFGGWPYGATTAAVLQQFLFSLRRGTVQGTGKF